MKKKFSQMQVFTFLTILLFVTACNVQVKKESSKEKVIASNQHNLLKTQGWDKGANVNSSLQDKAGNLWFGTSGEGIFKYDGKMFTQFKTPNGMNSLLQSVFLEDKSGKIWIGTSDGVCFYDDNKFTKIDIILPIFTQNRKNNVWSMMQDKSGKLWFATSMGVYTYDGKSFTPFFVAEKTSDCPSEIEYIFEDNAGDFWFSGRCKEGVFRYDGKTMTNLKPMDLIQDGSNRLHNWGWPQLQDKNGDIWFTNWGGAYRYDGKSFTNFTAKDGLPGSVITRMMEDSKGNLWFGGDGLSRYDGKSFTHFTEKDGLMNTDVWSILEDKNGEIWVGTRETGLYLYDGMKFVAYSEFEYKPRTDY